MVWEGKLPSLTKISQKNKELSDVEIRQRELLLSVPNVPNDAVAYGKDDRENPEVRRWGEPREFDFEAKPHWEIGKNLQILRKKNKQVEF